VIDAQDEIRIQRVMERDGLSTDSIQAIMNHQVDRDARLEKADDILDNSGTLEKLQSSIEQLHDQYLQISRQ
jgi:dephospho-CoA kinase